MNVDQVRTMEFKSIVTEGVVYSMMTVVNNTALYIWKWLRG